MSNNLKALFQSPEYREHMRMLSEKAVEARRAKMQTPEEKRKKWNEYLREYRAKKKKENK